MKIFRIVLASMIRDGKVTVELPNLDLDKLRSIYESDGWERLRRIEAIVCEEEMTDTEKVEWIKDFLN